MFLFRHVFEFRCGWLGWYPCGKLQPVTRIPPHPKGDAFVTNLFPYCLCVVLLRIFLIIFIPDRRPELTVRKYFACKIFDRCSRGSQRTWKKKICTPCQCFYFHTTEAHLCDMRESVQFRQLSYSVPQRCFAVAPLRSGRKCCRSRVVPYVRSNKDRIKASTILRNGSK